jgi:hypothetical protein
MLVNKEMLLLPLICFSENKNNDFKNQGDSIKFGK